MADNKIIDFQWAEELPEGCPPLDVELPNGKPFYRLVRSFPPTQTDFYSPRKLNSRRIFLDECAARALSIFLSIEDCIALNKIPFFKNNPHLIISITLSNEAGVIKHSPIDAGQTHHDWWNDRNFDPIPRCSIPE
jgi:hypothetical protein